MLAKNSKKKIGKFRFFLTLPLAMFLLVVFSFSTSNQALSPETEKAKLPVEVFKVTEKEGIIKIPLKALIKRRDRHLVFVVKKGVAIWTYVEPGKKSVKLVVIEKGLKDGDLVVVKGQMLLAHLSKVKITAESNTPSKE